MAGNNTTRKCINATSNVMGVSRVMTVIEREMRALNSNRRHGRWRRQPQAQQKASWPPSTCHGTLMLALFLVPSCTTDYPASKYSWSALVVSVASSVCFFHFLRLVIHSFSSQERRPCGIRSHNPSRSRHNRPFQPESPIFIQKEGREAKQGLGMLSSFNVSVA